MIKAIIGRIHWWKWKYWDCPSPQFYSQVDMELWLDAIDEWRHNEPAEWRPK